VSSSRFTEWGKSTEQTIDQITRRHIPLDRQQIQNSNDSLYNKFVLQAECNQAIQHQIRRRRNQSVSVRQQGQEVRNIVPVITL